MQFLPHNIQTKVCDPVVSSALEWIDWCAEAESNNCYPTVNEEEKNEVEIEENNQIQEVLENIITNQQIIYSYLQESFANTNQKISNIQINANAPQEIEEPIIDEREQQRLQIQAQIEALQNEMANL